MNELKFEEIDVDYRHHNEEDEDTRKRKRREEASYDEFTAVITQ